MLRHFPQPFHAGILHVDVGVQSSGDGLGNQGLPLLAQQLNEAGFLGHQCINADGFAVEELCQFYLFFKKRDGDVYF